MICKNSIFLCYRLSRAGAVAEYVNGYVLFCGGRNGKGVHSDCLIYDPTKDMWSEHTRMTRYDLKTSCIQVEHYLRSTLNDLGC